MYPFDIKIFASLTTGRIWNLLKVTASYLISRLMGAVTVWGRPPAMSIEPTNLCNLHCPHCPTGARGLTRPSGSMDFSLYQRIIDETNHELLFLLLYFQGEPFLHSDLCRMIRYARKHHIYTGTSTNGHFFRDTAAAHAVVESGLNVLIVSVDGTDQESYARYRVNGQLDVVKKGLERVVRARNAVGSNMRIYVQFLVFRHNEHQIEEMRRLTSNLGADQLLLKSAQIYEDTADADNWLPKDARFRRYVLNEGRLAMKGRSTRSCRKLWTSPVITADGRVAPCCFDKDATHSFGQLSDGIPFGKLWNSPENRGFRRRLVEDRTQIAICRNCTEGLRIFQ